MVNLLQLLHQPFFICFEKADFLRFNIVLFALEFDSSRPCIKIFLFGIEVVCPVTEYFTLIIQYLLLIVKFSPPHVIVSLFNSQLPRHLINNFNLFLEFFFSPLHDFGEFPLGYIKLRNLNFQLNYPLFAACDFPGHALLDFLDLAYDTLDLDICIDCPVPDLPVDTLGLHLPLINICENFLLGRLVIIGDFAFTLPDLRELRFEFALACGYQVLLLGEGPFTVGQLQLSGGQVSLATVYFVLVGGPEALGETHDRAGTFANLLG